MTRAAGAEPAIDLELDLFAGEMHYWRVARGDWRRCLDRMAALGLRVVSTCVPWGEHELRAGHHDWSAERDLGAFLDCVADAGMHAIVRPGPRVSAELAYFGLPRRIVENPALRAVSGRGTPAWLPLPPRMFPVPSYAARGFQSEVRAWLAAVGEVVAPRLAPAGPVIAVQVDHQAQMFYRMGAYDLDYHPDALAWWQEMGHGEAPRAWSEEDAERCVRWVRFKHEYTARSLAWIGRALDDAGLGGVARYHDLPPSEPSWIDLPRAGAAAGGIAGLNFHDTSHDQAACRRRALYLAGSATPLPFAPEVGLGGPPWLPPVRSAEDSRNTLLTVLSAGVRAFNLYMAVDRDRWYGAPIDNTGEVRPGSEWLPRLLQQLAAVGWTGLRRQAPVALIGSRAEAAFASASSAVEPVTPVLLELAGLGGAGAAELALDERAALHRRWLDACERALDLAQIPYDIVDERCAPDRLAGYRAVIVPTLERVDRALFRALRELAGRGVIVVIGPERPSLDEYGAPLAADAALPARAGLIRPRSLDDISGLADDLAGVAGPLPADWSAEDDDVDCALFTDGTSRPRVLFVSNRGARAQRATVLVPARTTLVDALTRESARASDDGRLMVELSPYQVRMFTIEQGARA